MVVLFGTFIIYRTSAQTGLEVGAMIWSGLSPFPKFQPGDLDIVYMLVAPTIYGGTSPYTIEIWIKQGSDPWQCWAAYTQAYSYGAPGTLWSTNAPTSEAGRTVQIAVKATDSMGLVATRLFTILLPLSSPTA